MHIDLQIFCNKKIVSLNFIDSMINKKIDGKISRFMVLYIFMIKSPLVHPIMMFHSATATGSCSTRPCCVLDFVVIGYCLFYRPIKKEKAAT